MAHQHVIEAVEGRMADLWQHSPVIGQNTVGEAPQDGSPYILIQYPASRTDRMAVGDRYYREEGGIRFVLHMIAGEGTARANIWANELTKLFRYVSFDGVETEAPTSPFFDDSNDAGGYFLATVVVPYHYDFQDGESDDESDQPLDG
jgi:hypothetical protein